MFEKKINNKIIRQCFDKRKLLYNLNMKYFFSGMICVDGTVTATLNLEEILQWQVSPWALLGSLNSERRRLVLNFDIYFFSVSSEKSVFP